MSINENMPAPRTREEYLMARMAGMPVDNLPEPRTREEYYLRAVCENPGTGGGGASSWKDLGEVTVHDTVMWDGNTDGRAVYMDMAYHISDGVPTKDDLANGFTVTTSNGKTVDSSTDGVTIQDIEEGAYAICILTFPLVGFNTVAAEGFPVGTYALSEDGLYVTSITVNGFKGYEAVKNNPIDYKYLPEALQFGANKQMVGPLTIDSNGLVLEDLLTDSSGKFYKFSDFIPTTDELMSASATAQGQQMPLNVLGELFTSGSGEVYGVVPLVVVTEAAVGFVEAIIPNFGTSTFPEAGMYTISEFFGASITFPAVTYTGHGKLDNKYLNLDWLPIISDVWDQFIEPTDAITNYDLMEHDWAVAEKAKKFRVHCNPLSDSPVTYECVPTSIQGFPVVGNLSLITNTAPNTGEPFVLLFGTTGGSSYEVNFMTKDDAVTSIAIDILVPHYNTLPEGFLPGAAGADVIELSGASLNSDYVLLGELLRRVNANGCAVCRYNGVLYSVLSVAFDESASVLMAKAYGGMPVMPEKFTLYVLYYQTPSGAAQLRPYMTERALYLDSSSVDDRGDRSNKRFKITVDDNGTLSAAEVT